MTLRAAVPDRVVADHLTSAPMSRGCRVLILSVALGAASAGTFAGAVSAAAPPSTPPAVTTTTVAAAGARGGATAGVAKPTNETWTLRRIVTLTALGIIALSAAGYAYGRLRSAPPRHPDLVRDPDEMDGLDNPHVGAAG
jgi:peptidoglycan/LPS O-acetylase OafA/YrhL